MAIKLGDLKKKISTGAQNLRTTVQGSVPQISSGLKGMANEVLRPFNTTSNYLKLNQPAVTSQTKIPATNIRLGPAAPLLDIPLRNLRAGFEVANLPSYAIGGALKSTREATQGKYTPPSTGIKLGKTDVGTLAHPTLTGVYRGITQKQPIFEEAPKTLGLKEGTLPFFVAGLAAEIAVPDPTDLRLLGKTDELAAGVKAAKGASKVEEVASKVSKTPVLDQLGEDMKLARKLRKEAGKGPGIINSMKSWVLDRFAPFEKIDRNTFINMRNVSGGGSARAEEIIRQGFQPVIQRESTRLEDFSKFLSLERLNELVNTRGLERKQTSEEIAKGLEELTGKYGAKGMAEMRQSATMLRGFLDQTLGLLEKSGIISPEVADATRAQNQFYVTFDSIGNMIRQIDEPGESWVKTSFNVAQQNVFKKIGESKSGVADPLESTMEKLFRTIDVADKNSIIRDFVSRNADNADLLKKLKEGEKTPIGWGKINFFENGQKQTYAIPKLYETAVKNLDSEPMHWALRIASTPTKWLKASAVHYNPAFWFINPVRDIQDAVVSEGIEVGLTDVTKLLENYAGSWSAALNMDDEWQAWRVAGGSQSTFMTKEVFDNKVEQAVQKIGRMAKKEAGTQFSFKDTGELRKHLGDIFDTALRVPEESTRVAKFISSITPENAAKATEKLVPYAQLPEDIREAAYASRNITLDFARSGSVTRVLNQLIPFFNVGVQGSARFVSLIKDNPVQAGKAVAVTTGIPMTLLYLHNRNFEDYKDVAGFEEQNNWVIMLRDRTPEERAAGADLHAVTIPMGNINKIFGGITTNVLRAIDRNNPQKLNKLAFDVAENISPVGVPIGSEGAGRTLGQVTPQVLKPFVEWWANKNFFTGFPVVPGSMEGIRPSEQYDEKTGKLAVLAGKATGLSPKKIENFVGTGGGTMMRVLTHPSRLVDTTLGRFYGPRSGSQESSQYEEIGKLRQESSTESFIRRREAKQILEDLSDKTSEEKKAILKDVASKDRDLYFEVRDAVLEQRRGISKIDRSVKSLPVDARAQYILNQYTSLPENERSQFLADMTRKKVLTGEVRAKMVRLMRDQEAAGNEQSSPIYNAIRKFFGLLAPEVEAAEGLMQTNSATVKGAGRGVPESGIDPMNNRLLVFEYNEDTGDFRDAYGFAGPLQEGQVEPGTNSYLYTYVKKGDTFVDEFGKAMPLLTLSKNFRTRVSSGKKSTVKIPSTLKTVAKKVPRELRKTKVARIKPAKESKITLKTTKAKKPTRKTRVIEAPALPQINTLKVKFPEELQKSTTPLARLRTIKL